MPDSHDFDTILANEYARYKKEVEAEQRYFDEVIKPAQVVFNAMFPKACKACGGVGWIRSSGSYWEPPDVDACTMCLGHGLCPLCGMQTVNEEGDDCSYCNWRADGLSPSVPTL